VINAFARMRWFAVGEGDTEGAPAGPRYVLRGLLRRAGVGGDARVAAELLPEGASKRPLWSGSFDAPAGESSFAQGDHLEASIIAAVEPALRLVETDRVRALPPGHILTEHEADRRAYTLMRPPPPLTARPPWWCCTRRWSGIPARPCCSRPRPTVIIG
jgi:hypothetical protein